MKQEFIIHNGSSRLTILFAGWGMDAEVFKDYECNGSDLLLCYNYTDASFDYSMLAGYSQIRIVAWSLGVWAAEECLRGKEYVFTSKTAINGTPRPADDVYGIPAAIYYGTLEGLTEASLIKFRRRMCGDAAGYAYFSGRCPKRDIGDLRDELAEIGRRSAEADPSDGGFWTAAIVGTNDRIFPAAAQKAMWEKAGVPYKELNIPHYSDSTMRQTIQEDDK